MITVFKNMKAPKNHQFFVGSFTRPAGSSHSECSSHAFPNSPILVLVEIQFHWVHCNKRIGTSLVMSMCINIIWIPPFLTWFKVITLFTIKWRNQFCPNLKTSNNFGVTCYKLLNICMSMLKLDLLQKNVVQNSHVSTKNIQWENGKNIFKLVIIGPLIIGQ
jgi:hypothetical protein